MTAAGRAEPVQRGRGLLNLRRLISRVAPRTPVSDSDPVAHHAAVAAGLKELERK